MLSFTFWLLLSILELVGLRFLASFSVLHTTSQYDENRVEVSEEVYSCRKENN